ncbi:hypothetical protein POVWA2_003530 [Plasmodium ovale wallikeri]|uniref:Uncharacterized protein n=1 Tax=Plasmodium ovale wallikeri TaxID=864142 RepID=A0A1A8YGL3_PLAOA|nr:hypothetical protein POVWA1_003370 [Plasmodium ovale wallikeri]SBT31328.1 hypothetical protein POVWA2_003530 [Plasmodium ovale wallikeri]
MEYGHIKAQSRNVHACTDACADEKGEVRGQTWQSYAPISAKHSSYKRSSQGALENGKSLKTEKLQIKHMYYELQNGNDNSVRSPICKMSIQNAQEIFKIILCKLKAKWEEA